MAQLPFLSLLLFFLNSGECRRYWHFIKHKTDVGTLEKGKPIQVPTNYKEVHITGINGTLYADSLSELRHVIVLRIHHHHITEIEKGALCSAPKLRTLELHFYMEEYMPLLTNATFENCDLEELTLKYVCWSCGFQVVDEYEPGFQFVRSSQNPPKIAQDAFQNLTHLRKLTLAGFGFRNLTKNFLQLHKVSLKGLILHSCNIEEIASDVFEGFRKLKALKLVGNNFTSLPDGLIRSLPKLKTLSLADNKIEDITWDEFRGSSIKKLDISSNQISSIDVDKLFRYMPRLNSLNIQNNPISCQQNSVVVEKIRKKLENLDEYEFSYGSKFKCDEED